MRRKAVLTWLILIFLAIANSGCAVIGAAVSAGMAYGIYQATKK
jgi:hypothetical protein